MATIRPELSRVDAVRNSERIIAAADVVFRREGLDATLDEVARQAGVGVATVYRRFADKSLLIDALFASRIDAIAALAEEGLSHPDPWQGICHFVYGAGAQFAEDRGLMDALLSAHDGLACAEESRRRIGPLVQALVAKGVKAGVLRPEVTASDFPMMRILLSAIIDSSREVRPHLWRRYAALLLDGLRGDCLPRVPLVVAPLTLDEVDSVMGNWRPGRRHGACAGPPEASS